MIERTQLFEVSTLYGLLTLNAALRAGQFEHLGTRRRILVCTNNSTTPEAMGDLRESPLFAHLAAPFDEVVSYNEAIWPLHPSAWAPSPEEMPLWERYFRGLWRLGDEPVHLVCESIQVPPSQSLAWCFPQASIDVYADGLMTYGPTRTRILSEVGARIERVLHVDLVPGLRPLLLSEFSVRCEVVPEATLREVFTEVAQVSPTPTGRGPVSLLLGQYLSPLGLLSVADEESLHVEMLETAVRLGADRVVFKPHPTAPAELAEPMLARAAELGVEVEVFTAPVLAETLLLDTGSGPRVERVVGCFSTALMTASILFGVPAVRVHTAELLDRLKPYPNSNRIPLLLVDQLLGDGIHPAALQVDDPEQLHRLRELVAAVGFVMQPEILSDLREPATAWLASHGETYRRLFPADRLGEWGLPGGRRTMKTRVAPTLRRVARRAYAVERRLEARFMGPLKVG